jgi:hypothetical protein
LLLSDFLALTTYQICFIALQASFLVKIYPLKSRRFRVSIIRYGRTGPDNAARAFQVFIVKNGNRRVSVDYRQGRLKGPVGVKRALRTCAAFYSYACPRGKTVNPLSGFPVTERPLKAGVFRGFDKGGGIRK